MIWYCWIVELFCQPIDITCGTKTKSYWTEIKEADPVLCCLRRLITSWSRYGMCRGSCLESNLPIHLWLRSITDNGGGDQYWLTTSRAVLLSFQPAAEAGEVKDVVARELLGPQSFVAIVCLSFRLCLSTCCLITLSCRCAPRSHRLSADNTSILSGDLFCSCVWISVVHVFRCVTIFDKVCDTLVE